jgi:hypothetical protein
MLYSTYEIRQAGPRHHRDVDRRGNRLRDLLPGSDVGWGKLGATLTTNCTLPTSLTPTGVEELGLAAVTGLVGLLLARSWVRTGATSRVWLMLPLSFGSLLLYVVVDAPTWNAPC